MQSKTKPALFKKTTWFRILMNWYPMYFGTGGKVLSISNDWKYLKIRLKLNIWTRNYVGTIFGGSMFSASDPFYMIMFMKLLGKDYIVWDKGGKIQFVKPGKETMFAEFKISDSLLEEIKREIDAKGRHTWIMTLDWQTKDGTIVSRIEREMWGGSKEYYNSRRKRQV